MIRSPIIHNWDFPKVIRLVQSEQIAFAASPAAYMETLIAGWKTHRLFGALGEIPSVPQASSGAYVVEQVKRWLDKPRNGPFFVWTHLMDVHNSSCSTFDLAQPGEYVRRESARLADMNARIIQKGPAYKSDKNHDFALSYVDEQIQRLHSFLAARGLLEDTIIVLTSDHGSRTAGYPRPDFKDITAFYDQLYHIPFALVHENFPAQRLDRLCSSMDIAPTLLDMIGLPVPREYRGAPVYSPDTLLRDHLVMEHVGRGPCDIGIKPINVCIRTKRGKAVFKSDPGLPENRVSLVEAYDLVNDRDELNNIASAAGLDPHFEKLRGIANARVREIRKTTIQNSGARRQEPEENQTPVRNKKMEYLYS